MTRYRITKYSPEYRNENGVYTKEDWTSCSDIGRQFDGKILTAEEYYDTEQRYIRVIEDIFCENEVGSLQIKDLECRYNVEERNEFLKTKSIELSDRDVQIIGGLKNDKVIYFKNLHKVITMVLRECIWCRLTSESPEFAVDFGYDFYIYVVCEKISDRIKDTASESGIYIEEMIM